MAVVQLVLVAVGAVLVAGAALAWRHGELRGGGLRVRRGERLFAPLVIVLAVGGISLAGAAAYIALAPPAPPAVARGKHFTLTLPDGFRRLPAVEAELPGGGQAFGDRNHELVIVENTAKLQRGGKVGDILRGRQEGLAPEGAATAQELDGVLELRWRYRSPRGPVAARALGFVDGAGTLGWVTATCSRSGESNEPGPSCEAALSAVSVTAPDRLPLSATVSP